MLKEKYILIICGNFKMTENDIAAICEKYSIINYRINSDMSVDVNGDVGLTANSLSKLPLTFGKVSGHFLCDHNQLTTLKGCPKYVGLNFTCVSNNLTNLKFCPEHIEGNFNCSDNAIVDLKHSPTYVGITFACDYNKISNVEFKTYCQYFYCMYNCLLTTRSSVSMMNVSKSIYVDNLFKFKF